MFDIYLEEIESIEILEEEYDWYDIELLEKDYLFEPNFIANDIIVHNSGQIEEFINNKNDPKKSKQEYDSIHKDMWNILGETYGSVLYQEQLMLLLQKVGNFTLAQAESARKALKYTKSDEYIEIIEKFRIGAKTQGVTNKNIDKLIYILTAYLKYSFNKSHSLAYAINAYVSMYLKVYYTKEYYATLFNYSPIDDINIFIKDAINMNINFSPLEYGFCYNKFIVDYKNDCVRYGLSSVKGLRSVDIDILNNDFFTNKNDLIKYIIDSKLNKKTIEILSKLGFFKNIIDANASFVEQLLLYLKSKNINDINEISTFLLYSKYFNDYSASEKFKFEKEYLGFYFSEHPFLQFYNDLSLKNKNLNFFTIPKDLENVKSDSINLLGLLSDTKTLKSKKSGREFYKLIIEDANKQIDVTIFDVASMANLKIGDIICVTVTKSNFGLTKNKNSKITILKTDTKIDAKINSFDEIIKLNSTESWF